MESHLIGFHRWNTEDLQTRCNTSRRSAWQHTCRRCQGRMLRVRNGFRLPWQSRRRCWERWWQRSMRLLGRRLLHPRRLPGHLAHAPLQPVRLALPEHGRSWNVCTEAGELVNKITSRFGEQSQISFSQNLAFKPSMHYCASLSSNILRCSIENSPYVTLATNSR